MSDKINITLTKQQAKDLYQYDIDDDLALQLEKQFPGLIEKEWEEIKYVSGYYINNCSDIFHAKREANKYNRDIHPTKKEAEAALALSQLEQWRDKYNGEPLWDWLKLDYSMVFYCIYRVNERILIISSSALFYPLSFKTEEIAERFLRDHRTLIETYYHLS